MKHLIIVTLLVSAILSPSSLEAQEGVGGPLVKRPSIGCACVPPSESPKDDGSAGVDGDASQPAKLSSAECRERRGVTVIYSAAEVDKKAMLLEKPEAEQKGGEGADAASGVVRLRAVLCPSGVVMRVVVIKGLSDDLNLSAIGAAKRVKFEPAVKDGRPVAQYIVLDYRFGPTR